MNPSASSIKAALWMAGSVACFLAMAVAGRALAAGLDVFQVMELRSVIGFLMLLPLVVAAGGWRAMATERAALHVGRNAAHYVGQLSWLYALTLIPLAELIAIEFTTPIWTVLLAVLFLGERPGWRRFAAVGLGLIGIVILVRPGLGKLDPGHLVVLLAALAFGISMVMVKSLTRTDSVTRIIFWMLIIQSTIGLVPAILVWRPVATVLWPWVALIAFAGTYAHFCLARALSYADATLVAPMDFLRLPLAALLGWWLYGEGIDGFTALGGAVILAGNLLNLQRSGERTAERPMLRSGPDLRAPRSVAVAHEGFSGRSAETPDPVDR